MGEINPHFRWNLDLAAAWQERKNRVRALNIGAVIELFEGLDRL
jgi:hypothetical protein